MTKSLQTLSDVDRQIAEIKTTPEANDLRKKIKAVQALAPKRRESFETAFNGARSYCELSVRAGELWTEIDNKRRDGRPKTVKTFTVISATDAGFRDRVDAMVCARVRKLTPEERGIYYYECQAKKQLPTIGGLYIFWKTRPDRHNGHNLLGAHNVKVIHGDMLKVILTLNQYFDLVIADPPYNVTDLSWDIIGTPDEFIKQTQEWIVTIQSILKSEYNLFWFCSPRFSADIEMVIRNTGLAIQSRIVWNRRNMALGSDAKYRFIDTWEMIYHCGSRKLNFPARWDDSRFDVQTFAVPQTNFTDEKQHETQKPLELIERLVDYGSYPGDSVLDPFAGSGTTGAACVTHPRECVLIEKEQKYIEVINARLGL